MAQRPIFIPSISGPVLVTVIPVEFVWHPGMSKSQKQKSIRSLHEVAAKTIGIRRILEISSKSEDEIGVRLSAFNLRVQLTNVVSASVEALFQGSKVFSNCGPFTDIYLKDSREAKKDERLRASGQLIGFRCDNRDWPLYPQTVFYDWLYLSALRQNSALPSDQICVVKTRQRTPIGLKQTERSHRHEYDAPFQQHLPLEMIVRRIKTAPPGPERRSSCGLRVSGKTLRVKTALHRKVRVLRALCKGPRKRLDSLWISAG